MPHYTVFYLLKQTLSHSSCTRPLRRGFLLAYETLFAPYFLPMLVTPKQHKPIAEAWDGTGDPEIRERNMLQRRQMDIDLAVFAVLETSIHIIPLATIASDMHAPGAPFLHRHIKIPTHLCRMVAVNRIGPEGQAQPCHTFPLSQGIPIPYNALKNDLSIRATALGRPQIPHADV